MGWSMHQGFRLSRGSARNKDMLAPEPQFSVSTTANASDAAITFERSKLSSNAIPKPVERGSNPGSNSRDVFPKDAIITTKIAGLSKLAVPSLEPPTTDELPASAPHAHDNYFGGPTANNDAGIKLGSSVQESIIGGGSEESVVGRVESENSSKRDIVSSEEKSRGEPSELLGAMAVQGRRLAQAAGTFGNVGSARNGRVGYEDEVNFILPSPHSRLYLFSYPIIFKKYFPFVLFLLLS